MREESEGLTGNRERGWRSSLLQEDQRAMFINHSPTRASNTLFTRICGIKEAIIHKEDLFDLLLQVHVSFWFCMDQIAS